MNMNSVQCTLMTCILCIFIYQFIEYVDCQRPLNVNGTIQQPQSQQTAYSSSISKSSQSPTKLLHQLNRLDRLKQLNRSNLSDIKPNYYSPIDDDGIFNVNGAAAASPVRPYHELSDQQSVYSSSSGKYFSSKPSSSEFTSATNRGRKHTFTDLRNLTSGRALWELGDDPDRNNQKDPLVLLKNRLQQSNVSILFVYFSSERHKCTMTLHSAYRKQNDLHDRHNFDIIIYHHNTHQKPFIRLHFTFDCFLNSISFISLLSFVGNILCRMLYC